MKISVLKKYMEYIFETERSIYKGTFVKREGNGLFLEDVTAYNSCPEPEHYKSFCLMLDKVQRVISSGEGINAEAARRHGARAFKTNLK